MSGPFVLVPLTITDAMLTSSTAAEPSATETAWNAATSYTVGQQAILTSTHRVYANLIAGVDATSPDQALTGNTPRWQDVGPTNKWAAFDSQVNTQTAVITPLTYVLRPGLFNAINFYGLDGATIAVTVKDAVGGVVIYSNTTELVGLPMDHYDYYFGPFKPLTKVLFQGVVPYADPEVTISITAGAGVTVKAGMIVIGDLRGLVSDGGKGGTEFGATAKPLTYSYINTDKFGKTSIIRRGKATDMDIRVSVPNADTDSALATIQEVLDIPAAWIGSDVANFTGLSVFGLASGEVTYVGPTHSTITINVKGLI